MSVHAKPVESPVTPPASVAHASTAAYAAPTLLGHPRALFVLFFTEMWERFSYYGMRALLVLYMVRALGYSTQKAGAVYGWYQGCVFLTPIVGGYLADRYLGQRKAVYIGGALIALGHAVLMFEPIPMFYLALGIIILGNGFFKPNISVIVGRLYDANDPRRDGAFSIFYMGINIGGFLAPFVCGTLGQLIGWRYGFGAAGVGMVCGLCIYSWGQKLMGEHGLRPVEPLAQGQRRAPLTVTETQRLVVLLTLAVVGNILFWASFEQAGSSMALFADRATQLHIDWLDFTVPSSWFQSANPMFIALLAPAFSLTWVWLSRRGWEPSTPLKFAFGLLLLSAGFAVMMAGGARYDAAGPVSMNYLLLAFLLNTAGELCLSPVGLSAVTKLAPGWLTSAVMGLWFGSMAIGNWLSGHFAGEYDSMRKVDFFAVPTYATLAAGIALLLLARPLRKWMHGIH